MDENIQTFLEGIKVGAKQSHKNMTLYCLLAAKETDVDFIRSFPHRGIFRC